MPATRDQLDAESSSVSTAMETSPSKGVGFWMIIIALLISFFMAVIDSTIIATALPTIAGDLHATEFIWLADSYGITSTTLLPLSGGLAEAFGRRPVLVASLVIFALGSALSGAAQTANWLVASRAILGIGAGGILALTSIVIADIVALHERGLYTGLVGLTWSIAGGIGPVVGGSLAQQGQWRWLFYLALPINGVAIILVVIFLRLPTPPGTVREKLGRIDWIGNFMVIGSSTAIVLGLVWGGVEYPWVSAQVLTPLLVGGIGIGAFIVFERRFARNPLVPTQVLSNRTSLSGYAQTAILSTPLVALYYYLPVYYQACKSASPTASGIDIFAISFAVSLMSIVAGVSVTVSKRYRPQMWVGWAIAIVGFGLFATLEADTSRAKSIGYQIVCGVGIGLVYSTAYFPVLAPLPVELNAQALSLYVFLRSFSQIWGVAIGGAILQNGLTSKLPVEFLARFPAGQAIAYSVIPQIPVLEAPLRDAVRIAFAESLVTVWQVMIGIMGLGFISSLLMKALPLSSSLDSKWAAGKKDDAADEENIDLSVLGPASHLNEGLLERTSSSVFGPAAHKEGSSSTVFGPAAHKVGSLERTSSF